MFKFSYTLKSPNLQEKNIELYEYFLKIFKAQNTFSKLPPFSDIEEEFLISKGLKQRKTVLKSEKIKWDILYEQTDDGFYKYLKCRVDEENRVNVLIQNSFEYDFNNATEKSLDCARLFYTNEYPIIIIEDHNGGGTLSLAQIMNQILQIRIANRRYESFRLSDISKEYFNSLNFGENWIDIETCDEIKAFNDINETIDHYNYNNLNIEHRRTKIIDRFSREMRNGLNNFREEYFNSTKAKKPTEIVIFTDSFSYSAASGFIRSFQSTGGAIVVGYYGNPSKEGKNFFDASQSHSNVQTLDGTEMKKNLNDLGFTINGVTCGEFYDDFREINPIPRE